VGKWACDLGLHLLYNNMDWMGLLVLTDALVNYDGSFEQGEGLGFIVY